MGCAQSAAAPPPGIGSSRSSKEINTSSFHKMHSNYHEKSEDSTTITTSLKQIEESLDHSISKDGVGLLVKSTTARTAFLNFLRNEYKNPHQPLSDFVDRLEKSAQNIDYNTLSMKADDIVSMYVTASLETKIQIDGVSSDNLLDDDFKSIESPAKLRSRRKSIVHSVYMSQGRCLLVLSAFPFFANSKSYEDWCENEYEMKQNPRSSSSIDDTIFAISLKSFKINGLERMSSSSALDRVVDGIMSSTDCQSFLHMRSWLNSFISIVEDLPVCITLASANKNQRGFPLIHVNKMFSVTTGYPKSEIIGKNCRFLQTSFDSSLCYTESAQVEKIAEALHNAVPIKVKITNYRKDGSRFKNLLALKPIFDTDSKYCFVVGVQIDCTSENADVEQINLVDNLLFMIPNFMHSQSKNI